MKDFVPYKESLQLKELEFDEPCFGRFYTKPKSKMFGIDEKGRHYLIKNVSKKLYTIGEHFALNDSSVILAPTFSQAFRFFRKKYGLENYIKPNWHFVIVTGYCYIINDIASAIFKTQEEAELECLRKLIEIVKNAKTN